MEREVPDQWRQNSARSTHPSARSRSLPEPKEVNTAKADIPTCALYVSPARVGDRVLVDRPAAEVATALGVGVELPAVEEALLHLANRVLDAALGLRMPGTQALIWNP